MKSKIKMPKMDQLLNDKNVLYIVFVVAILNLLGYLITNNLEAVVFFLIVGFLSTYFSKNMIIVLIISIITTSIFATTRSPKVIYTTKEGMETMKEGKKNIGKSMDKDAEKVDKDTKKDNIGKDVTSAGINTGVNAGAEAAKEGMDGIQGEPQNQSKTKGKGNRIDYANTLEKAYENLQSKIGEGGVEGLTQQTASLVNQQKELMDNINKMTPFIETAEGFLNNLNLDGLEKMGGLLSKFTGDKKDDSSQTQ
jgi:hypothetical protein|uniref:Uncharacterized protein n=1 Tax=viral metagenome TaxID=1070528 RepID=A0A6C0CW62_9ZZZZ